MNCPVDHTPLRQAGYTHACDQCGGAWVADEVLVPMLEERANTLIELEWKPRMAGAIRACPSCSTAMQTVMLGTIALDRCPPHGVWFDSGELVIALKEAKQFRADPAPHKPHESLLHKLGKLLAID
jgi:Zn-finger nucleic acid-binding protein